MGAVRRDHQIERLAHIAGFKLKSRFVVQVVQGANALSGAPVDGCLKRGVM